MSVLANFAVGRSLPSSFVNLKLIRHARVLLISGHYNGLCVTLCNVSEIELTRHTIERPRTASVASIDSVIDAVNSRVSLGK